MGRSLKRNRCLRNGAVAAAMLASAVGWSAAAVAQEDPFGDAAGASATAQAGPPKGAREGASGQAPVSAPPESGILAEPPSAAAEAPAGSSGASAATTPAKPRTDATPPGSSGLPPGASNGFAAPSTDDSALGISAPARSENIAELLAAAMARNPDIAVAEAKVRSAQVELDRARLDVSRQVIEAIQAIRHQRRVVEVAKLQLESSKQRHAMIEALHHKATVSASDLLASQAGVGQAELEVAEAEAKLEAANAALDYLTGQIAAPHGGPGMPGMGPYGAGSYPGSIGPGGAMNPGGPSDSAAGATTSKSTDRPRHATPVHTRRALAEAIAIHVKLAAEPYHARLRRTLDEPTSIDFNDTPLADVLRYLDDLHGISNVVIDRAATSPAGRPLGDKPITLKLDNVPLHAALKAVEDVANVSFVVTSYGLVLTAKESSIKDHMLLKDFVEMPRVLPPAAADPSSKPTSPRNGVPTPSRN